MENVRREIFQTFDNPDYLVNVSCDYDYMPPAIEFIESLGTFGIVFVTIGTIVMVITLCLAVDSSHTILFTKQRKSWKRNVLIILFVYPITSLCSLVALAIPRTQLLSEAVTQTYLTISLYRLYLLLIDVGRREIKKSPSLRLRVGPCCCWPCLPFPDLDMNPTNLSWLQIIVIQLPIVQTLVYVILIFMSVENPLLVTRYGIFLQPLSITSLLLGLYGLTITLKSLQEVNSGSNLGHKVTVLQLVLLFSKLQGSIIKSLSGTGLFPCNPPITPQVYANFTYNALMLIEMLFLCYAARHVYGCIPAKISPEADGCTENQENPSSGNATDPRIREDDKSIEIIYDENNSEQSRNNNDNDARSIIIRSA